MNRLIATLRLDVLNQFRQGFYYASAFVLLMMAVVIGMIPQNLYVVLPGIWLTNMVIATYVFLGGMLVLEKGERTLEGQVVTPLRTDEYLASKIITLSALAIFENVAITVLAMGEGLLGEVNWGWVLVGSLFCAVLYVLLGLLTVIRYDTLNEFLIPMTLITGLLEMPGMVCLGMPEYGWLYLLPTHGTMLMFLSALEPRPLVTMIYAVVYPLLWIAGAYWLGRRALRRFITGGI